MIMYIVIGNRKTIRDGVDSREDFDYSMIR